MTLYPPREIPTMQFSNPVFNDGVNVTVRRGTKWMGVDRAFISLGGTHTTGATILHTRVVPFFKLTDMDVKDEHDPNCRTVLGLAAELKRVYPEFIETDEVTVCTFIMRKRVPELDDAVFMPDMVPYFAGSIEDVIELHDDFYEIMFVGKRAIVHASKFVRLIDDEVDGWFVTTSY